MAESKLLPRESANFMESYHYYENRPAFGPCLEHIQKKLLDFFDLDVPQLFDFELRPYRSNESI